MTGATFDYARQRGTVGKIGQLNPLGRFGVAEGMTIRNSKHYSTNNIKPPEIANAALFLASGSTFCQHRCDFPLIFIFQILPVT